MNQTNFEHAGYALLMQLALWPFVGAVAGGLFAVGFFLGREHSQREEIISPHDRSNPFPAFKIWEWSLDEKLDLIFPILVVLPAALIFE